jgi:hypothetical protein
MYEAAFPVGYKVRDMIFNDRAEGRGVEAAIGDPRRELIAELDAVIRSYHASLPT